MADDDKENCVRMTRAATKRKAAMAAATIDEERINKKKRVVLGELPNLCNIKKPRRKATKVITTKQKNPVSIPTLANTNLDIDTRSDDPQMCAPYVTSIFEYLRQLEGKAKSRPLIDYIDKIQKDVTSSMRGVLVDWLVEVAEEYKLLSETLYLAVSYIDRFLSLKTVNRQRLQLLGVASMLIASKYEEITPPNVNDFCYITDHTYTKQEIVKMEADILLALEFELGNPTSNTFLRRFTRVAQEDFQMSPLQMEFLCSYLSELSMLDYNSLKFLPSIVAASAVFLARFIIRPKQHPWQNVMLEEYTKYKAGDLKECVRMIHDLYLSRKGGALQAIREKYKQHKFKCVATMPVSPELPLTVFEDVNI
ncbi:PREDICTED: putative cyclin-A3-1 isoform X1 [Camelina sativa]|uniref:Cyclin-A3-1 isoform X1 n=1 Tax=Camelina sativa TaxID=90675 RepID=A0ABM0Y223_CAMSA|nr:PREDICTED: putative cyclin-A3-1 isoform X1 [Camelina sativa]